MLDGMHTYHANVKLQSPGEPRRPGLDLKAIEATHRITWSLTKLRDVMQHVCPTSSPDPVVYHMYKCVYEWCLNDYPYDYQLMMSQCM